MDVTFASDEFDRLETDPSSGRELPDAVVKMYRRRLQVIRGALDERDFYNLKSLHYEKLKGKRQHQRSMRLNAQWRLILDINESPAGKQVHVVGIEDYH